MERERGDGSAMERAIIEPQAMLAQLCAARKLHAKQIRAHQVCALALVPSLKRQFWQRMERPKPEPLKLFGASLYTPPGEVASCSLAGPAMGAPLAAMVLEMLIALGAKSIIALGFCGALNPSLKVGNVLIPTAAFRDEGTSGHYLPPGPKIEASTAVTDALARAAGEHCLLTVSGSVWTTDAVFRETEDKARHFRDKGALGVEMEMAALYSVARFRGVEIGGVLVVTDETYALPWTLASSRWRVWRAMVQACELALEASRYLAR